MAETRVEGLIDHSELLRRLNYDPDSGLFYWTGDAANYVHRIGNCAGSIYDNGYRYVELNGSDYRCGRLAWFYVTGIWPTDYVDHINGMRADDRFVNLRIASNSQNQANRGLMTTNTSGLKGVRFQPSRRKWIAIITVNGKAKNLGRYATREEAAAAYDLAAIAAWGEFAVTNASLSQ